MQRSLWICMAHISISIYGPTCRSSQVGWDSLELLLLLHVTLWLLGTFKMNLSKNNTNTCIIQKLNIDSFSHSGIGRLIISGEFEYPRGVATTKDDYILVLDSELGRVTVHSPSDGQRLKTIQGMFMHLCGRWSYLEFRKGLYVRDMAKL